MDHPLVGATPLVTIAHRAGNSIEQAQQAAGAGVDVVEADLWLHGGRLEVRHSKTFGPLPVRWDRWWINLFPPQCLDLESLLRELDPETTIMLDLKGRNSHLPGQLLEVCRRVRPDRQILVCSQTWPMLEVLRHEPDVAVIYSIGNRRQLARSWTMLEPEGYEAVSIHSDLLTPETTQELFKRVPAIITWPINDHVRLERVRGLGVTGIISDSLELLHEVRMTTGRPAQEQLLREAT